MPGHVKELSSASFAARLHDLMFAKRISSAQLARDAGVSERLIRKYRSGVTEPRDSWGDPTENAHKLADAIGVPVAELVPPRPTSPEVAA